MGFGSGGKTNGLYQPPSAAAKKPNMQLIQADHELFLQAFESESQLSPSCMCEDAHLRAYLAIQEVSLWPCSCKDEGSS